jgi:hypothetical protein
MATARARDVAVSGAPSRFSASIPLLALDDRHERAALLAAGHRKGRFAAAL